ncbi:hypothetical protein EV182_005644 [Spiromyces aspiralis]|uniref:Uncharacterized protein n=1 Tax=Spiromyces aspiralis TaxID=68401 RepID=A0ACC1HAS1_9FUNG|nr:hypothetical protein EV182_005644 [Spiromyces aspiralis]
MPTIDRIMAMHTMPNAQVAVIFLERACMEVAPILENHGLHIQLVHEFYPLDSELNSINSNNGKIIMVRLRDSSDAYMFYPYNSVVEALLSEIVPYCTFGHELDFEDALECLKMELLSIRLVKQQETILYPAFTTDGGAIAFGTEQQVTQYDRDRTFGGYYCGIQQQQQQQPEQTGKNHITDVFDSTLALLDSLFQAEGVPKGPVLAQGDGDNSNHS